jgi:PKD repeat protein
MIHKIFRNQIRFISLALIMVGYSGCQEDLNNLKLNQQPSISAMTPAKVLRGEQNVEGRITGENLLSTSNVDLGNGITVSDLKVLSATEISFLFSVNRSATEGQRTVTVTTANGQATAQGLTVGIQQVPFARFSIHAEDNWKGSEIKFDASPSTADFKINSYRWEFGDGGKDRGITVVHKYHEGGKFNVTLEVEDNRGGVGSISKEVDILNNFAPVARFSIDGTRQVGKPISFDASASADRDSQALTYRWNFGDGKTGDRKRVTHTYQTGRTFQVKLTVKDKKGASDTTDRSLDINRPIDHNNNNNNTGGTTCQLYNYNANWFTVKAVNGFVITADVLIPSCPSCGEIRRRASGIQEFVGDLVRISGYNLTFDPVSLPLSTRPVVGERLYVVWRRCG